MRLYVKIHSNMEMLLEISKDENVVVVVVVDVLVLVSYSSAYSHYYYYYHYYYYFYITFFLQCWFCFVLFSVLCSVFVTMCFVCVL
jgi:hypothetical protein